MAIPSNQGLVDKDPDYSEWPFFSPKLGLVGLTTAAEQYSLYGSVLVAYWHLENQ